MWGGGVSGEGGRDLDLGLVANLKTHRAPGVAHNGAPDCISAGHAIQSTPRAPCYQSRGYGGAALAACLLQLPQPCVSCSSFSAAAATLLRSRRSGAAACGLQLSAAKSCPVTNARAMGALHQHPSRCCCCCCSYCAAAAAAAIVQLLLRQHSSCSRHAAAFWLLLSHCRRSSPCAAAAFGRQLTAANPCCDTNRRAMGVLHRQPSYRSCRSCCAAVVAAAAAAVIMQQHIRCCFRATGVAAA